MAIINAKLFISKNYFRIMHGYLFYICFYIDISYENNIAVEQLLKDTICWQIWQVYFKRCFGLVYLFIHSVTYVILDASITDYNLYITAHLIMYGHPHNTI